MSDKKRTSGADRAGFREPGRCRGCGGDLPGRKGPQGPVSKWCSESCRKKSSYGGNCVDCGKPTAHSGNGRPSERCPACVGARTRAKTRQWLLDSIHDWVDRYGEPPCSLDWNMAYSRRRRNPDLLPALEIRHMDRKWPPVTSVVNHFGSWTNFVREAGYTPNKVGRPAKARSNA